MIGATLDEIRRALLDQLGDAADLVRDEQLDRWFNRGRQRLGIFDSKTATLTWNDGDASVDLPDDCVEVERFISEMGSFLPQYLVRRSTISFLQPARVTAGIGTLYYQAQYPDVTAAQESTMPRLADEAAISFAMARFYERIAGTRADFRRYATVTGQSGIDVRDLLDLANRHDADYADARQELAPNTPASFYGD